jgi:hypothetical protein
LVFPGFSSIYAKEVDKNYIRTLTSEFSTITLEDVSSNPHGYSISDVVEKLRDMDAEYTASHSKVLIRLKDQETTGKYLNRFVNTKGADVSSSNTLSGSRAPWLIPLLINHIGDEPINSSVHPNPERAGYYGLSGSSLQALHFIVMRSEDLPRDVNEWASSMNIRGEEAMNEARKVYMKWWEVNKVAFETEAYKKVVPLGDHTNAKVPPDPSADEVTEAVKEAVAPKLAIEDKPADIVVTEPIEEDVESSSDWWLWLIGALVVLGGIGLVIRRKS